MAIYGYTKNYKLIKPQYDTDTWHDYEYDNLDTIDAVLSAIYASGNWKGFWATNAHYAVDDIVIDRDTDTMYKVMVEHTTSEGSFAAEQTAHPDYYELWSPNDLAESWATKTDGKVAYTDYSAKAYAISSGLIDDGSAKEWAVGSGEIGNTNEYSAKKYAIDAHNDYISMTTNANVVAVSSNINNVNAVGQSISSVNTVATNISSVNTAASNMAAIKAAPTAATNAAQSAAQAANSATISANSAIWAEGTDAQVQALGGVHSSKGWAEQSTNANVALTNSPYTTNRILEIPQDIKLELNNGTLTLKAGSKVYVPNEFEADGTTPKFDVVTIVSDLTASIAFNGAVVCYLINTSTAPTIYVASLKSGTGSGTGTGSALYYSTDNNKMYVNGSDESICFPFAIATSNGTQFTSIDQVFNGFGYIGSTLFALPGVKCLVGNGRNPDGSCITKIEESTKVDIYNINSNRQNNKIVLYNGKLNVRGSLWFDEQANMCYNNAPSISAYQPTAILGTFSTETTSPWNIKEFNPLGVDSLANSSLSNLSAAGQAKFDAKANVSNTVTTNTDQTITSVKTYTATQRKKSTTADISTTPDGYQANEVFRAYDKNNNVMGIYHTSVVPAASGVYGNTGEVRCAMDVINKDGYQAGIRVNVPVEGTTGAYATAPNTPDNAPANAITTKGYVQNKFDAKANTDASNFNADGKSLLSGLGMPSNRYIDLTLGANGSTYTAPANGWFVLQCEVSGDNKYFTTRVTVSDYGFIIPIWTGGGSVPVRTTVPCSAGKTFVVSYNCTINETPRFRFIYAEGEEN